MRAPWPIGAPALPKSSSSRDDKPSCFLVNNPCDRRGHRKASRLAQADALCREILKVRPDHPPTLQLQALIAHDEGDQSASDRAHAAGHLPRTAKSALLTTISPNCAAARVGSMRRSEQPGSACSRAGIAKGIHVDWKHPCRTRPTPGGDVPLAASHRHRAELCAGPFQPRPCFRCLGPIHQGDEVEERSGRLDPSFPEAFCSRGITLYEMGCREEAQADWKRAIALNPSHADAHTNLAISELLRGNLAEGFSRYEWRWEAKDSQSRPKIPTPWKGEDLSSKQLLVHAEQGFGDTIQFCRYLPLLRERGAQAPSLSVPAPLRSLIAHSMPWLELCDGVTRPPSDVQSTLLSLPLLLKTTLDTIPAPAPYIARTCPTRSLAWARIMGGRPELKVGLVWAGSPNIPCDKDRSIPFAALAPILAVKGARFFSLQIGPTARDASTSITDLSPSSPTSRKPQAPSPISTS